MKIKRLQPLNDNIDSDMNDSIDNMTSDDIFLPQAMQPQVTINESPRYDASAVKRENSDVVVSQPQSPSTAFRGSYRELPQMILSHERQYIKIFMVFPHPTSFSFHTKESTNANAMQNTSYPYNFSDFSANNDITMQNDSRSIHMDIPAGEKTITVTVTNSEFNWCAVFKLCLCKFSYYHSLRTAKPFFSLFRSLFFLFLRRLL